MLFTVSMPRAQWLPSRDGGRISPGQFLPALPHHACSVATSLPSFFGDWFSTTPVFSTVHHGSMTTTGKISVLRAQLCLGFGELEAEDSGVMVEAEQIPVCDPG